MISDGIINVLLNLKDIEQDIKGVKSVMLTVQ